MWTTIELYRVQLFSQKVSAHTIEISLNLISLWRLFLWETRKKWPFSTVFWLQSSKMIMVKKIVGVMPGKLGLILSAQKCSKGTISSIWRACSQYSTPIYTVGNNHTWSELTLWGSKFVRQKCIYSSFDIERLGSFCVCVRLSFSNENNQKCRISISVNVLGEVHFWTSFTQIIMRFILSNRNHCSLVVY